MYEAFYGLKAKPFSILPDPTFLYWTGGHRMAFSMLEYGIVNRAGFTVITGEIGSGKTTLIRYLLGRLPGDINAGLVSNFQGDRAELVQWILKSLGQDFEGQSLVGLYSRLETFLVEQHGQGRRTVLIIDEAQNLGAKALEELRMMSNLNTYDQEFLQIILSGQPELKALLGRPELAQFAQRVSSDFHLGLLPRKDVSAYIGHRLTTAGADRPLFSDEACDLVHAATHGTPRLINILCDTALMYGFAQESEWVTSDIVKLVLDDKRQYGVFPLTPVA